ncbi:MAG TPA: hypothetical protein VMF60_05415 [Acidimicrobiales bacterium]|nr:hypothetical protein [Acidimicrobiales bacterium]
MDESHARELLSTERRRVETLVGEMTGELQEERRSVGETGDVADRAEPLTALQGDAAVAQELRDRLDQIARAEDRLRQGTYGRSVRSGRPIADERLEADPAAELTAEEAAER